MRQKKIKLIMVAALAVAPLLAVDKESVKRLEESVAVFSEVMATPDKGISGGDARERALHRDCPGSEDSGFVFGGKYGKGYLSCRNKGASGWSAPATVRIEGGSVGFQIGGSQTDLIMLVMNERGADKLLSSKFTLGAEGSVAAGPVGRTATAQTDAQMQAEILSWSRSQGLFAGLALEGATLRQDQEDNVGLYGRKTSEQADRHFRDGPTQGCGDAFQPDQQLLGKRAQDCLAGQPLNNTERFGSQYENN